MNNNKKCEKKKEQQKEKRIQKHEDSVRSSWDNFKHTNSPIMELLEEEKDKEIGNLFEKIMKENYPNLVKEIDIQLQEAQ